MIQLVKLKIDIIELIILRYCSKKYLNNVFIWE